MPASALTGTRIREKRSLMGLRQADLARAAGISPSYLNLIEHNRRNVAGDVLARIAAVLDVRPAALAGGADAALLDGLRDALGAADPEAGAVPEIDRIEEFAARFPGWAAILVAQQARMAQLERMVEALSDRINHDPHLSATLHELLSAVASVRSTAAILADTPDIEPEWRDRFQRNLAEDTARLSEGAESLVAYLDNAAAQETAVVTPQEELDAWLTSRGWHLPEIETGADPAQIAAKASELASQAARSLAEEWLAQCRRDAQVLPLAVLSAALADHGPDPARLAQVCGVAPAVAFRRLAMLPPEAGEFGLVICDGAGTVLLRKPLPGFGLPRFGAACPLWPLYLALARPGVLLRRGVDIAGRSAVRFVTHAFCQVDHPDGYDAAPVLRAYMLLSPETAVDPALPRQTVGSSCRICPRRDCSARAEPTIVRGV